MHTTHSTRCRKHRIWNTPIGKPKRKVIEEEPLTVPSIPEPAVRPTAPSEPRRRKEKVPA